jgi:hypothetical protein
VNLTVGIMPRIVVTKNSSSWGPPSLLDNRFRLWRALFFFLLERVEVPVLL